MKLYIGSDHAGFELKEKLINYLTLSGHEVFDKGTYSLDSCDYPNFSLKVCEEVVLNNAFGILVCYTGIGMSISANKVTGIRASLVNSVENAMLTRSHNNANVLCLGAKDVSFSLAKEIVDTFINTEFSNNERHINRVNKVLSIEKKYGK